MATGVPATPAAPIQTGFGTHFTYDPNGNVKTRTDAKGATTNYDTIHPIV